MIDGPDLDARPRIADSTVRSAEPRHAGYHVKGPILWCDNEFVNSRNPI
jgi:hypothetical protein